MKNAKSGLDTFGFRQVTLATSSSTTVFGCEFLEYFSANEKYSKTEYRCHNNLLYHVVKLPMLFHDS